MRAAEEESALLALARFTGYNGWRPTHAWKAWRIPDHEEGESGLFRMFAAPKTRGEEWFEERTGCPDCEAGVDDWAEASDTEGSAEDVVENGDESDGSVQ